MRMPIMEKKIKITRVGGYMDKLEPLCTVVRIIKTTMKNIMEVLQKI
jgi:hypothetical protein